MSVHTWRFNRDWLIELDFIISAHNRQIHKFKKKEERKKEKAFNKENFNQITLDTHCKLHHLLSGYEHLTRNVDIRCRFRLSLLVSVCMLYMFVYLSVQHMSITW